MADPRFNFVVKCPNTANKQQTDQGARKDFFNAIGKVGDIELLNRVDGEIAGGLRTLASTSNAIRGGDVNSAIIGNGKQNDPNGANIVLSEVGINPQQAQKAGQFNPGVLNRGTAEAQNVYDRVVTGKYELKDIPNSVQDLQNLKTLADGIFTEGATEQKKIELCGAKNYAQALIQYAPKHKFMFILQFTLKAEYQTEFSTDSINNMAWLVKSTGRPNINIEHEEVNFYNFWSRVPKRTIYEPVTMRFHDDIKNHGHSFFRSYLEEISPIARIGGYEKKTGAGLTHRRLEDGGLNGSKWDYESTASLGQLQGDHTSIIDELRVFQLFDYGTKMTVYTYKNPKFLSMNLDDLDMAEGATGNEIEIQFAYDALNISPTLSVKEEIENVKQVSGLAVGVGYNGHIEPVYGVGPAADEAAGGIEEGPSSEGKGFFERAGSVIKDTTSSFIDDAKQTYNSVYNSASDAIDSAASKFDSPGGGDDIIS
jgi:hypothetical protein